MTKKYPNLGTQKQKTDFYYYPLRVLLRVQSFRMNVTFGENSFFFKLEQ
jgi:hypothetical protein